MPTTTYAFIDTETTGLDPSIQEMFELAIIFRERNNETGEWENPADIEDRVHFMVGPENLKAANPVALEISGFHKRSAAVGLDSGGIVDMSDQENPWLSFSERQEFISELHTRLDGVTLVGANPAFDAKFIEAWFKKFGKLVNWHHRMIDVEAMALQKFNYVKPKGLQEIAKEIGYNASGAHTAMGDVETTVAVFEALTGL